MQKRTLAIVGLSVLLLVSCEDNPTESSPPDQSSRRPDVDPRKLPKDFFSRPRSSFKGLKEGECIETTVAAFHPRLNTCTLGKKGEVVHHSSGIGEGSDCGMAVEYAIGEYQSSYETNLEVKDEWRVGDPIKLCRLDKPEKCPPGLMNPGAKYRATNLRTGTKWEEFNRIYATGCEERAR